MHHRRHTFRVTRLLQAWYFFTRKEASGSKNSNRVNDLDSRCLGRSLDLVLA